ncbi:hypothetical protein Tco_0999980 [Tanacetum coccineum]
MAAVGGTAAAADSGRWRLAVSDGGGGGGRRWREMVVVGRECCEMRRLTLLASADGKQYSNPIEYPKLSGMPARTAM